MLFRSDAYEWRTRKGRVVVDDVRIPRDRDQVVPRCEKRIKARAGEVPLNLFVIFPVPCRISRLGRQGCRLWEILGSPSQERGEMG